jgi:cupin fold WbuC family metalloprotein
MITIDKNFTDRLSQEAVISRRKRKNYNFHTEFSDPINRMLHAMEPETYVQPHKHENPDKREAFIVLSGRVTVVEFDNQGRITEHIVLDPLSGNYGAEIKPRTWHCLIALERTIVYEVKDGPYDPSDDKYFAPWAPAEGDPDATAYKVDIINKLSGLF